MNVLFPSNPLNPRQVDASFAEERLAAIDAGHNTVLVSLEDLTARFVGKLEEMVTLYRGWMLSQEDYVTLFHKVMEAGSCLGTSPEEYQTAHHLPNWYNLVSHTTPKSLWFPGAPDVTMSVYEMADHFGRSPVIVKDYVKSQKHYWNEACFIPDASDQIHARKVVNRFLELQGSSFTGGLVFREYLTFDRIKQQNERSEFPLIDEYRAFMMRGYPVLVQHMWSQTITPDNSVWSYLTWLGRSLSDLPFIAVDVARLGNDFRVIEIGDGQVSSVPHARDYKLFYGA